MIQSLSLTTVGSFSALMVASLFLLAPARPVRADDPQIFAALAPYSLRFEVRPAIQTSWKMVEGGVDAKVYFADDYRLTIVNEESGDDNLITFHLERTGGQEFKTLTYEVAYTEPLTDRLLVYSPNHSASAIRGLARCRPPEPFEDNASAIRGVPFAQLATEDGRNRLACGWLDQARATVISGAPSEAGRRYHLKLKKRPETNATALHDSFFISSRSGSWFDVTKAYTSFVESRRSVPLLPEPEQAIEPAYDCWYITFDHIDDDSVLRFSKTCSRLGIFNYLLDSGWDMPVGEYARQMVGKTGDYHPPKDRFPAFNNMLERMEGMQINPILWLQPFMLGRAAQAYPEMKDSLINVAGTWVPKRQKAFLCPRDPKTRLYLRQLFERVMTDYHPVGGVWLDAIEWIPTECIADHPHDREFGPAVETCLKTIRDSVRRHVPEALIQMRYPYANLHNKPFGNTWQASDSPKDYEGMRLNSISMHAFGEGVRIATDEQYWPITWKDDEVARCLASVVLTGVPALSFDIDKSPTSHMSLVDTWMKFYHSHKGALTDGDFAPFGRLNRLSQTIATGDELFAFVRGYGRQKATIPANGQQSLYLVNGEDISDVNWTIDGLQRGDYRIVVRDRNHAPVAEHHRSSRRSRLDLSSIAVEKGGLVELHRD